MIPLFVQNLWVVFPCNFKNEALEIGAFAKELILVNCLGSLGRLIDVLGQTVHKCTKKLDFVLDFIGTEKTAR